MHAWLRLYVLGIVMSAVVGFAAPAAATLVFHPFGGTIDAVDPDNPFGLTTSDVITGHAIYDDSLVPGSGDFDLAIDSDPDFDLVVVWGEDVLIFTANDDIGFGFGFPLLNFIDGSLVDIDFVTNVPGFPDLVHGTDSIVNAADPEITIFDTVENEPLIDGTLVFEDEPEPVPAPGTLALIVAGLALLGFIRHRRAPRYARIRRPARSRRR